MSNRKHKTMLSEHFSLEELTYSRIAVENGLDNEPSPAVRQSLCWVYFSIVYFFHHFRKCINVNFFCIRY